MSCTPGDLPDGPAERLVALRQLEARWQAEGAHLQMLLDLTRSLQQSQGELSNLFADVSDAPAPAIDAAVQLAAEWAAATTFHLQLLTRLVEALGPEELGLENLIAARTAEEIAPLPQGPAGSFVIEEMEADVGPSATLPRDTTLIAALYSADTQLQRPWAQDQVAGAAQQLLLALAAKLAPLLIGRPEQAPEGLGVREVATSCGSRSVNTAARRPDDVQQLLVLVAPAALEHLRPVMAAKVDHDKHKTARLEPYTGPGNFERCMAAGQVAWLLRHLSGRHLSTVSSAALPAVLAAIEDPFPAEQACGLWALQHMAVEGQASDLRVRGLDVVAAAKHALAGCSDVSWPAAAAAAIAVVSRLEGSNPYSQPYHDVMAVLVDEGELSGHDMERAAAWLAAAPLLFPRLGLQLAAHFSRLMPLLLGWCLAPRRSVRAAALHSLLQVERLTWPRLATHAGIVWRVLQRVLEQELQRREQLPADSGQTDGAVAELAQDCALALWFAAGTDFQVQLMANKGSCTDDLLQAVMQQLEETVPSEAVDLMHDQ